MRRIRFDFGKLTGSRIVVLGAILYMIGACLYYAVVGVREKRETLFVFEGVRVGLLRVLQRYVHDPEAALLNGLLIGDVSGLPREMRDDFRKSGLGHIVAVSGYNVTKISGVVLVLLVGVGLSRRWAMVVASLVLFLFLCVAGFSASLVRAVLMFGVGSVGYLLGRQVSSWRNVLYTAFCMMVIRWDWAVVDLGFCLSFLAIVGLGLYKDFFEKVFRFVPETFGVRGVLAETTAVFVMVTPFSLVVFGSVSMSAFVANVLVLPFVPFAMVGGVLMVIFSVIAPVLAEIVGFVVRIILHEMIVVGYWFSLFGMWEFRLPVWVAIGWYVGQIIFHRKIFIEALWGRT
jgi:competence protein ComEC